MPSLLTVSLLAPALAAGPSSPELSGGRVPFGAADRAPAPGPGVHHEHERLAMQASTRGPAPPPAPSARPDKVVYGYLPYWTVGPEDVPWDHLTHLAIFNVDLESDGSLSDTSRWTGVAADAVAMGHAAGVKVHLCVTSFDDDVMDAVLSSASRRAAAIEALGALVDAYGADGVNVDFEGMPSARRDDLVTFTRDLRARVGEVWLATPAVDWSDAYDYPALADASDGLFIMGYAYHYTGGGAGPNSPLSPGDIWSRWALDWTVDDYLATGAPADKIVLGLPSYGQEWPVSSGSAVPADTTDDGWSVVYTDAVADAATYGRAYDTASDTPWFTRSETRQAWYDDADSLAVKMDWAVGEAGLAGFGFWAIGYDGNDPALWAAVDAASHTPGGTDTGADDTGTPDGTPDDTDRPPRAQLLAESAGCGCDSGGGVGMGLWTVVLLGVRRARRPSPTRDAAW
ncbi:MAG: glycosyl hydrolase family 18 protein [Pseudomonadota bacterium]|nr:glycosyl hydrolase family 18 protein [Pseudomonadota bacterium]